MDFVNTQGRGFVFARTDWEYVLNTFVFGMAVGYDFISSAEGACNGNFVGIGADCCANASVRVQAADPWGILVSNGEFTSFSGGFGPDVADHTQVVTTASNVGAVRFVNSAFWGPSNQIASIDGTGSVGFNGCIFNQVRSPPPSFLLFYISLLHQSSRPSNSGTLSRPTALRSVLSAALTFRFR